MHITSFIQLAFICFRSYPFFFFFFIKHQYYTYSCSGSRPSLSVQSVRQDRHEDTFHDETSLSSGETGRVALGNVRNRCPANTPDSSDSPLTSLCKLRETIGSTLRWIRIRCRKYKNKNKMRARKKGDGGGRLSKSINPQDAEILSGLHGNP